MNNVKSNDGEIAVLEANGAKVERSLPIVVTLRDRITDTYTVPRVSQTSLAAQRDFAAAINNGRPGDSSLVDHPEHFTLYKIGYWNDQTGEILHTEREVICSGDDVALTASEKDAMVEKVRAGL